MISADTIVIFTGLLAAIAEIEEFKGAWRALTGIEGSSPTAVSSGCCAPREQILRTA